MKQCLRHLHKCQEIVAVVRCLLLKSSSFLPFFFVFSHSDIVRCPAMYKYILCCLYDVVCQRVLIFWKKYVLVTTNFYCVYTQHLRFYKHRKLSRPSLTFWYCHFLLAFLSGIRGCRRLLDFLADDASRGEAIAVHCVVGEDVAGREHKPGAERAASARTAQPHILR